MVTISIERYNELIRKEVAYEVRKAELEQSNYKSMTDKILFDVKPEPAEEDDDF